MKITRNNDLIQTVLLLNIRSLCTIRIRSTFSLLRKLTPFMQLWITILHLQAHMSVQRCFFALSHFSWTTFEPKQIQAESQSGKPGLGGQKCDLFKHWISRTTQKLCILSYLHFILQAYRSSHSDVTVMLVSISIVPWRIQQLLHSTYYKWFWIKQPTYWLPYYFKSSCPWLLWPHRLSLHASISLTVILTTACEFKTFVLMAPD